MSSSIENPHSAPLTMVTWEMAGKPLQPPWPPLSLYPPAESCQQPPLPNIKAIPDKKQHNIWFQWPQYCNLHGLEWFQCQQNICYCWFEHGKCWSIFLLYPITITNIESLSLWHCPSFRKPQEMLTTHCSQSQPFICTTTTMTTGTTATRWHIMPHHHIKSTRKEQNNSIFLSHYHTTGWLTPIPNNPSSHIHQSWVVQLGMTNCPAQHQSASQQLIWTSSHLTPGSDNYLSHDTKTPITPIPIFPNCHLHTAPSCLWTIHN